MLLQIDELEGLLKERYASWLGFCHNDLQYGNMLLHTATPWSLSEDKARSAASFEAAIATESVADSVADDDAQSLSGFSMTGGLDGGSPRADSLTRTHSGAFEGDGIEGETPDPTGKLRLSIRFSTGCHTPEICLPHIESASVWLIC